MPTPTGCATSPTTSPTGPWRPYAASWASGSGAVAAGIPRERIVLDPGLKFAKRPHHNWELLRALDELAGLGRPLLVGASRKSFLGTLLADDDGPRPVDEREHAHAALVALLAARASTTCACTTYAPPATPSRSSPPSTRPRRPHDR